MFYTCYKEREKDQGKKKKRKKKKKKIINQNFPIFFIVHISLFNFPISLHVMV